MVQPRLSTVLSAIKKGFKYDMVGKLPMVQAIVDPAASSATAVLASTALADGETTKVTAGITSPDFPRVASVTGNQGSVAGDVLVVGRDASGRTVKDLITASGTSTVDGKVPMASIDYIVLPEWAASGDEISVGTTDKLGLAKSIELSTDIDLLEAGGTAEAVSGQQTGEHSYFEPTTVPDGSTTYKVYFKSGLI